MIFTQSKDTKEFLREAEKHFKQQEGVVQSVLNTRIGDGPRKLDKIAHRWGDAEELNLCDLTFKKLTPLHGKTQDMPCHDHHHRQEARHVPIHFSTS